MPRNYTITLILTLLFNVCQAQFTYKENRKHINASIGYFSLIDFSANDNKFKHGASIAIAYSFINKSREKLQRKNQVNRILDRDIYIKTNFSTYKREKIHNTFSVSTGPAFRITIPEGMFYEFDGQVGYMRTFLKGDHFVFENDNISATSRLGNNLLLLQGNAVIGWNFTKSNDYPAALYIGAGMMSYFPNNKKWLFQPQFQAGLTFVLVRLKESYNDVE